MEVVIDKFDRNTKEIQAESVAFWVAEMIGNGLDTSERFDEWLPRVEQG